MSTATVKAPAPRFTRFQAAALYKKAMAAGDAAAAAAIPAPMVVGTPKNLLGSLMGGDDGGFDPAKPVYYVSEGVCGRATVVIRPGNSSFARFVMKNDYGYKRYYGGVAMSVVSRTSPLFRSQSYERYQAAASAAAAVLREAGIDAYVDSWMD